MNDHDAETPPMRPPSLWKRLLLAGGAFALLLTALGGGQYYLHRGHLGKALTGAVAELDATDPGWRRHDLEAARPVLPETENGARVVTAAHALKPAGRPDYHTMEHIALAPGLPPHLLDAGRLGLLRREMAAVAAAVAEARRLAEMPRGRHRLVLPDNPLETLVDEQHQTRTVANLLRYDALLLSQQGRHVEALRSCRATLNAGRSVGDEPSVVAQIIRTAVVAVACAAAEKTLALGEPPADDLAGLQRLLREEERHPTLRVALRGERAMVHDLFVGVAAGRFRLDELVGSGGRRPSVLDPLFGLLTRDQARREHPRMLRLMNKAVANAALPPHEQPAAEAVLEREMLAVAAPGSVIRELMPAMTRFADATRRKTACVRCLDALLAVERYQRDKGAWPAKLADVTPKYLPAVPLDPYDGKPLRYMRTKDGAVVYSVGKDGRDDGGFIRPAAGTATPPDVGYQLWDPALRRQPPPAVRPK
jgi:hypothetical protein